METLHLVALLLTVPAILYADHIGFNYMRGKTLVVDRVKNLILHRYIIGGLMVLIVSGIALSIGRFSYLSQLPQYWVKMAFVAVLAFNGWIGSAVIGLFFL